MEDKIFNVFSAWFDSDLVNVDSPQEVEDAAASCAADLVRNLPDIEAVITRLTEMQSNWTPDLVLRFISAGQIDWLYDKPTEQVLKRVLVLIIVDLRYYQGHPEALHGGAAMP